MYVERQHRLVLKDVNVGGGRVGEDLRLGGEQAGARPINAVVSLVGAGPDVGAGDAAASYAVAGHRGLLGCLHPHFWRSLAAVFGPCQLLADGVAENMIQPALTSR